MYLDALYPDPLPTRARPEGRVWSLMQTVLVLLEYFNYCVGFLFDAGCGKNYIARVKLSSRRPWKNGVMFVLIFH